MATIYWPLHSSKRRPLDLPPVQLHLVHGPREEGQELPEPEVGVVSPHLLVDSVEHDVLLFVVPGRSLKDHDDLLVGVGPGQAERSVVWPRGEHFGPRVALGVVPGKGRLEIKGVKICNAMSTMSQRSLLAALEKNQGEKINHLLRPQ